MDNTAFHRQVARQRRILDQTIVKEVPIYDEGSTTPTLQGSGVGGTFTYDATNTGLEWTRIGNRIYLNGRVRITAIAVAPTGDVRITGLPVAAASPAFSVAGGAAFTIWQGITLPAGYTQLMLRITSGQTFLNITRGGSNVGQANVQGAELVLVGGVANFDFEGFYRVA